MKSRRDFVTLEVLVKRDELDWLKHASKLRRLSVSEYVKRAVNTQLCKEGVDAVLFRTTERL